ANPKGRATAGLAILQASALTPFVGESDIRGGSICGGSSPPSKEDSDALRALDRSHGVCRRTVDDAVRCAGHRRSVEISEPQGAVASRQPEPVGKRRGEGAARGRIPVGLLSQPQGGG